MSKMSKNMQKILRTVADAKTGRISGWSVARWMNTSSHPEGVREGLRGLTNRGLILMHPMDDPADEFRQQFPDRLKAEYSIAQQVQP